VKQRVQKFLERGDEWLAVRRQDVIIRGNNTNNYSESTMRVLKDIVLSRTKAFNVVALVDFCSTVLQAYLVRRLLAFAHGRRTNPRLVYAELCDRMRRVDTEAIAVVSLTITHITFPAAAAHPQFTLSTLSSAFVPV